LGEWSAIIFSGSYSTPGEQTMAQAKLAAEKALQLDSNLAEAHAALGLIAPYFGWNWADGPMRSDTTRRRLRSILTTLQRTSGMPKVI
jgi:hypothetical protein